MLDGTLHELMVITGEVAGVIDEVLPAAEIVRRMAAEEVLRALSTVRGVGRPLKARNRWKTFSSP